MHPVLVCQLVLGNAVHPVGALAVYRVAEHYQLVAVVRVGQRLFQVGYLATAGSTPAGPEVDEHIFAPEVREGHLFSLGSQAADVGSLGTDLQVSRTHLIDQLLIYGQFAQCLRHRIKEGLYHIRGECGHHRELDDVECHGRVEVVVDEVHEGHLEMDVVDIECRRGILHLCHGVALHLFGDACLCSLHAHLALFDALAVQVKIVLVDVVAWRTAHLGTYGVCRIEWAHLDLALLDEHLYATVVKAGDVV